MKSPALAVRLTSLVLLAVLVAAALHWIQFEPASYLLYAGLFTALGAAVCVVKPMQWIGLGTRKRAVAVALAGVAGAACGLNWPVNRMESTGVTLLDDWQRESDFRESHSVMAVATPEQALQAAREVTFGDLKAYRFLARIRAMAMGQAAGGVISNSTIVRAMTGPGGGFSVLAEQPGREVVMGAAIRADARAGRRLAGQAYREYCEPGWVKVAFNVRAEPAGGGLTRISTETRVLGCDRESANRFARYWRFIYPGSALLRKLWLDSMLERAERM